MVRVESKISITPHLYCMAALVLSDNYPFGVSEQRFDMCAAVAALKLREVENERFLGFLDLHRNFVLVPYILVVLCDVKARFKHLLSSSHWNSCILPMIFLTRASLTL